MSSSFLKSSLDGIVSLVEGLTKLIDTIGVLPTLFTAITAFRGFSGKGIFKVIEDDAQTSGKRITNIFKESVSAANSAMKNIGLQGSSTFKDSLKADISALNNYKNELSKGAPTVDALDSIFKNASANAREFAESGKFASQGVKAFIKQQKLAEVATVAQNKSLANAISIIREYYSGCKNVGVGQKDFAAAVNQTNPALAKQLTTAKTAKAAMSGYITSLVASRAATIGMTVAATAMNAAISMGISLAITGAIKLIDKLVVTQKELAEQVDEVTSKYKEQHDALMEVKGDYDTSDANSMISRYAELSKGVNSVGENISLTAAEYEEYQGIVDQIANQIPELVTGFNSQGTAILSCAGDVDTLTEAYKNLIIETNKDVIDTGEDIFNDFSNKMKKLRSDRDAMTNDAAEALGNMLTSNNLEDGLAGISNDDLPRITKLLEDNGFERNVLGKGEKGFETQREFILRAIQEDSAAVKAALGDSIKDIESYADDMNTLVDAYFSTEFLTNYSDMSDEMQAVIKQFASNFDVGFYSQFTSAEDLTEHLDTMLEAFNNLSSMDAKEIETIFSLQTQFNNGEISYGEYVTSLNSAGKTIDELVSKGALDSEIASDIKLNLGLNDENVVEDYKSLLKRLTDEGVDTDVATNLLDGLSASQYEVLVNLVANGEIDFSNFDADSLKEYIEEQADLNEAMNFTPDIAVDTDSIKAFNEVLAESATAAGLSSEAIDSIKAKYSELDSYDASALFERTANGIKVNREELAKLNKEQQEATQTEVQEHIDTLAEAYNNNATEIDKCTNAAERAQLIDKGEAYKSKIEELAEYQAQLEGVTGAYQRWIDAQNTPQNYEGYQAVATGREDVEDEISRGFISNATKEYIDLLSGEDLVGGTIDDYAEAWENLDKKVGSTSYSIHDFFTVNDDGDITATGIDRFFKGLQQDFKGSVAEFNDKSGKWEYDFSQENLQKIQDEWGIGIEAIELMLEAAVDAGYDVDWGNVLDGVDIDTAGFETLISLAETAQKEFNKIEGLEDVDFNFAATGLEEATDEVEKARQAFSQFINEDGTVNLEAEGAEQMQVMFTTLLLQKQQLATPSIMKVDTSQLDESQNKISEVITAAQGLQSALENYEIAISTGVDVEEAQKNLNTAISTLEGTDADIRADLKLPSNEELQSAANGLGKIKVGANLDETAVGTLETKIQSECTPEVIAKVTGLDETAIQNGSKQVTYTAEHSDVDNFLNGLTDISKKIIYTYTTEGTKPKPKNIEKTITYKYEVEGTPPKAYGTAHSGGSASGMAFARGNWGIKGNGTALGGELGQELIVRDGKFFTIGDKGAEFFQYKHNDIVFNAAQTESLFKYGGIKGAKPRGTMLASGSAFAEGNAFPWNANASESNFASNRKNGSVTVKADTVKVESKSTTTKDKSNKSTTKNKTTKSKDTKKKSKDTKDDFEETFDWIEIAISRLERAIDRLDKRANRTYKSWSYRNKRLAEEIPKVREEINLQEKAYKRYIKEANSVGLSSKWKKKVKNGEVNIQDIKNEDLAEKIKEYQTW